MSNGPLHRLIADYLRQHTGERLTADAIAKGLLDAHPERFADKGRALGSRRSLHAQLTREVYAQRKKVLESYSEVATDTSKSPLRFFIDSTNRELSINTTERPAESAADVQVIPRHKNEAPDVNELPFSEAREHGLYPLLQRYMFQELDVVSKRIRETTSSNRRGKFGNKWLHPDVVGMFVPGQGWDALIRDCAGSLPTRKAKLISIEVKIRLTASDVRESFFQAASNSLWANRAYLAATEVKGEETLDELNTLCALHGVGYMSIDPDNYSESRIVIPAREREEVDWASANRIAVENADFRDYLKNVLNFLQSGHVMTRLWEYTDRE